MQARPMTEAMVVTEKGAELQEQVPFNQTEKTSHLATEK